MTIRTCCRCGSSPCSTAPGAQERAEGVIIKGDLGDARVGDRHRAFVGGAEPVAVSKASNTKHQYPVDLCPRSSDLHVDHAGPATVRSDARDVVLVAGREVRALRVVEVHVRARASPIPVSADVNLARGGGL